MLTVMVPVEMGRTVERSQQLVTSILVCHLNLVPATWVIQSKTKTKNPSNLDIVARVCNPIT